MDHIPNHEALALQDLLAHRRDKPRMVALVCAIAKSTQDLEDRLIGLLYSQTLEVAQDDALRQLGEAVGEERGALEEAEYRQVIAARILARRRPANMSKRDHMIRVAQILTAPSTVRFWYRHPMGIRMDIRRSRSLSDAMLRRSRRLLDQVNISGYGLDLVQVVEGQFTLNSADDGFGSTFARSF